MINHYQYLRITALIIIIGSCYLVNADENTPAAPVEQTEKKEEAKPGISMEKPIVLKETDLDKIDKYIRDYIDKNYPDYDIRATLLMEDANERTIKVFAIKKGEESIDLHFDIEDAMVVFREKHKKEIEELSKDVEIIWDDTKKD